MPYGPIQVNSALFLKVHLRSQRCDCGGVYASRKERRVRRREVVLRKVYTHCTRCHRQRLFEYDVTGLDEIGDDRSHFLRTVTNFLDAMSAFKREDFDTAEEKFLRALDEVSGEPNFTAAHYYLGRIALDTGRTEEAIRRFDHASFLQPMELAYHQALLEAYQSAGNVSSALAALAVVEDLKLRAEAESGMGPPFEE